jgi:hypothetical protein
MHCDRCQCDAFEPGYHVMEAPFIDRPGRTFENMNTARPASLRCAGCGAVYTIDFDGEIVKL